ncbi:MAG: hypothetical protein JXB48_07980 [Candidatus Latescibacteria bacterium]|nr:hypothetical protein [Candidatus Latescibacterota bacterium]
MTIESALFLLSDFGKEVTETARDYESDTLLAGKVLRSNFSDIDPSFLSSAIELVQARIRGWKKFGNAEKMFFTNEALQQATDERVADHRAARFKGLNRVCDACCGIGGDAIALGKVAHNIDCVDNDPSRLLFCGENLRVNGIDNFNLIEENILNLKNRIDTYDALFIDPSRRPKGKRTRSLYEMIPPLSEVEDMLSLVAQGAVKLPPSVERDSLSLPHELEWVSTEDGLKEAVAWVGDFRRCDTSVTALHKNITLHDTDLPEEDPGTSAAENYLYEPDPALIRSGLLGRKAAQCGMKRICENIAYMTSGELVDDPFFGAYRVLDAMKFNLKNLARRLDSMNVGNLTIKKRGFPMLPEELQAKLHLRGDRSATIIATKELGKNTVFYVEPV